MLDIIKHQQWIVIAFVFFGILAYIAIIRWRDRKWIDYRFGHQNPVSYTHLTLPTICFKCRSRWWGGH